MHVDIPKQKPTVCHYIPIQNSENSKRKWKYEGRSKIQRAYLDKKPQRKKDERIVISPFETKYKDAKERISELCDDKEDLSSPNQEVKAIALYALELLRQQKILPSLINATGDESLLFEFFIGEHSFSLDFYNNGEIIYLRRIKNITPYIAEIDSEQLEGTVSEIAHIYAETALS